VILCDIQLPGTSGLELLRQTRELQLETPFVLMTAGPGLESALEGMQYEAFHYLAKPFPHDALTDTIQRAVNRGKQRREPSPLVQTRSRELDRPHPTVTFEFGPVARFPARELVGFQARIQPLSASIPTRRDLSRVAALTRRIDEVGRLLRARLADTLDPSMEAVVFTDADVDWLGDDMLYSPSDPLSARARRVVLQLRHRE